MLLLHKIQPNHMLHILKDNVKTQEECWNTSSMLAIIEFVIRH